MMASTKAQGFLSVNLDIYVELSKVNFLQNLKILYLEITRNYFTTYLHVVLWK